MSDPSKRKPSRRLTALLGLVVFCLVMTTVAGRLGRYWWVADIFSHLTVYYACAGMVMMGVAVVVRRWRIALIAAAGLTLNVILLWPQWVSVPADTGLRGGQPMLRLVHLNVLRPNCDKERVVGLLNECNADAVFVQEADPWWVDTLHEADIPYHDAVSQTGHGRFGIMMLMRDDGAHIPGRDVRLVSSRILDIVAVDADRPAIEAVFTVGGQEVAVLSVHPSHPINAALTSLRDEMLRATKDWADRQDSPCVVIGDLNTTPWSYAFSILTADGKLISTLDGRGNQGSIPAHLPVPWMLPIDHCLHSVGLVCVDRHVGPRVGSDHLPLLVTLSLADE